VEHNVNKIYKGSEIVIHTLVCPNKDNCFKRSDRLDKCPFAGYRDYTHSDDGFDVCLLEESSLEIDLDKGSVIIIEVKQKGS